MDRARLRTRARAGSRDRKVMNLLFKATFDALMLWSLRVTNKVHCRQGRGTKHVGDVERTCPQSEVTPSKIEPEANSLEQPALNLGEILIKRGVAKASEVTAAVEHQKAGDPRHFGEILGRKGGRQTAGHCRGPERPAASPRAKR